MSSGALGPPRQTHGFAAYKRETVTQYFSDASEQRARLLAEIATARRRIADARLAIAEINEAQYARIGNLLAAQRAARQEWRAHEVAVTSILARAEAQAEEVLHEVSGRFRSRLENAPTHDWWQETDGFTDGQLAHGAHFLPPPVGSGIA